LLTVFGLFVIGFFSVGYFFSVPQRCGCQATTIPGALSAVSIFENTIVDSNIITIRTADVSGIGELQICYSQKPTKGVVDQWAGLQPRGCEYDRLYELKQIGAQKTDEVATVAFEITDRVISIPPPSNDNLDRYNRAKGVLFNTLILLPLSGAQPTWRGLLLPSSRSKMTRS
jgi:hypothetical protein